jgi:hypothetical protein
MLRPDKRRYKLPRAYENRCLSDIYGVDAGFVLKFYVPMLRYAPNVDAHLSPLMMETHRRLEHAGPQGEEYVTARGIIGKIE